MRGSRRRFPRNRSTVLDILFASRFVPAFPLIKSMNLSAVANARKNAPSRVGWTTLFAKAHALVSQEVPELRELFVKRPFRHLYQHPCSVLSVSVHRRERHDDSTSPERLIWGQISNPESLSLIDLQQRLDALSKMPLEQVYRDGLILEKAPNCARKFVWCWVMNWGARKRAKHVGTFSISSLAGHYCLNAYHPLVTTSSLAFGPIGTDGRMDAVLISDHRVIDGVLAAKALQGIESKLNSVICDELSSSRDASSFA